MTTRRSLRAGPRLWRSAERDECSAYCVRVKTPRPLVAGLFALSALLLSGCSPEAAVPSAPHAAEGEALFASDEEALAAAEAAYAQYLEVYDAVFAEGGAAPERLEKVATGEVLTEDLDRAREFQTEGTSLSGKTTVLETSLQQLAQNSPDETEVITYACLDAFSIDVLDASGSPIGNPERDATVTFELRFTAQSNESLLLAESTIWKSGPSCAD